MRIALVSPYSWTYPGGVTRHIEALAEAHIAEGHEVTVFAPADPPDRLSERLHRGAEPQLHRRPHYLVELGRTVGIPANGAVSNLTFSPAALARLGRELDRGGFDVVHIHEPVAPLLSCGALSRSDAARVATFHTYSTGPVGPAIANALGARRRMRRGLHARIAVSEAASWTARRFYGGRYAIVPNGVHVEPAGAAPKPAGESGRLQIAFVGQAVERKGLGILLSAFQGLREHVAAELVIVGANAEEVEPMLLDRSGITVLGRVDDERKREVLARADVLCAPSLGGESFGMVLTEAFAAGTPVVASDIAGYRDVVEDGVNGILVAPGDPVELAETLRALALDPALRQELAGSAAASAQRFAWPRVAHEAREVYAEAIVARRAELPARGPVARLRQAFSPAPADGLAPVPARRLPTLEPEPPGGWARFRMRRAARRIGLVVAGALAVGLSAIALHHVGVDRVAASLLRSSPVWVLAAIAVMALSMFLRSVSWHVILSVALPDRLLSWMATLRATAIGVLMSATLPARLGEPARAIVISRRAGDPRETMPAVVGTLVSQTVINVVALVLLGLIAFSSVPIFDRNHGALVVFAIGPALLLLVVLALPLVLKAGASGSSRVQAVLGPVRVAAQRARSGLKIFLKPRAGAGAVGAQLAAWALQALSCYLLLVALGLNDRAGIGAAAAVLLAVNVTALIPATPANVGVFQAACVAVLTGAYGISAADALGYGIVLQAVELTTAVVMGVPALLGEGLTWKDVRMRAIHSTPVRLGPVEKQAGLGRVEA
ncbi:MAG: glycosyltransferase [Solirubrobacteraceae bacterium]|nr:glycosyltransferase [Solirubrobacteraceae bacterium]